VNAAHIVVDQVHNLLGGVKDAGIERHINPGTLGFLTEGIKLIVIEKQLGDQVINPAIDLDFQVFDILIE